MKTNLIQYNLISLLFFLLSTGGLSAQQLTPFVVSSSGGFYSTASGTLSFTTGEMSAIETFTSPTNILTQGFQQIWELGTSTKDNANASFSVSVNPNPSDGLFNLIMESDFGGHVDMNIVDLLGRKMKQASFDHEATRDVQPIDLSDVPPGIYLMTITVINRNDPANAYPVLKKIQIIK